MDRGLKKADLGTHRGGGVMTRGTENRLVCRVFEFFWRECLNRDKGERVIAVTGWNSCRIVDRCGAVKRCWMQLRKDRG